MVMAENERNGAAAESRASSPASFHASELDLNRDDRLPWLDSDDEDYDYAELDTARVVVFVVAALVLLGAIVGGIWWATHRGATATAEADGRVIAAPAQPYKEAPKNPGGKTFVGTGDISYGVSQGKDGMAPPPSAPVSPSATPVPQVPAPAAPAKTTGGIGVQIGAYGSQATAEAGWSKLSSQTEALKGVSHRVIEGNADIGKVYRLQAVAGDEAGANALCGRLKAAGIPCQVKR